MKSDNKISADVFLLTGEWSDYSGKSVLKFIGTSDELGPIEIIVTNNKPVFFIEKDAVLNPLNKTYLRKETKLKNFNNKPVDALYFNTQKALNVLAETIQQSNQTTYESDVDPLRRFLMEKSINSQMKITGAAEQKNSIVRFTNPTILPCDTSPNFVISSIDIETGAKTNQLYSIAVHTTGKNGEHKKVFMIGEKPKRNSCLLYTSDAADE